MQDELSMFCTSAPIGVYTPDELTFDCAVGVQYRVNKRKKPFDLERLFALHFYFYTSF
jgi:hypothetical protein